MPAQLRTPARRILAAAATASVLSLALTACGSPMGDMPGTSHSAATMAASPSGATPSMNEMPGMGSPSGGDGLSAERSGYRLDSAAAALPAAASASYAFTITGPDGKPVTDFAVEQTRRLHFYAIRSDLTGFQHLHPTMAADGTWTAPLDALQPGSWRLFTSFTRNSGSGKGAAFVLSRTVTVPGTAATTALPAATDSATVDGYTVTVNGELMAGMAHPLTVTITKDGQPVTDLQPYLDTYAHLTAFHATDAAFAHLHPETTVSGDHGGPALAFHAELANSGDWRLFLQFQTAGQLHTAALTLHVG